MRGLYAAEPSHREAALQTIKFVQQNGGSLATCRQVANQMIQEVNTETSQSSTVLSEVDLGQNCPSTHQDEVNLAQSNDQAAQVAHTQAVNQLAVVSTTEVTMEVRYDPDEQTCAVQVSNPSWQAAKAAYDAALASQVSSDAVSTQTAQALSGATALQAAAVHQCQCKAQAALAASVQVNTANSQQQANDWNLAHNLICTLDNTPPGDCNIPPVPTVTIPVAPAAVTAAQCSPTSAPTNAPTNPVPAGTCNFVQGDGVGGSEIYVGQATSPAECETQVRTAQPTANGATISSGVLNGNGSCYAEIGSTGTNDSGGWLTCIFT